MIQLERIGKVYERAGGPVQALDGVDLRVSPGEFVAVSGPSGCGKTTLLSIVGALIRPTTGRVVVGGDDLGVLSAAARAAFRARRIGFVFQMFHLLPYLTVLENVLLATGDASARQAAQALLERFGLGPRLNHRPAELSAGERQRVAIARAMIHHPPLILADEPTGNLDPQSAAEVLEILGSFHRQGATVLLVTHQEQATAKADRVVFLRGGRVVDSGGSLEKPGLVR
jgi:putative ABC transport system ATP-binding protein